MISGFLRAARLAPRIAISEIAQNGSVLILAPHPDDETLGCGQLIAALTAAGMTVQIVVVTDGGASHPGSRLWPADVMAELRAREVREAVALLGAGRAPPPVMLNYPDLAAPDDPESREVAADRIRQAMPPDCQTLLSTWEGDPHPDHQRVARIAQLIGARHPDLIHWAYPIWGRFEEHVPKGRMVLFDDPEQHAVKSRALAAHQSQMTGLVDDDPSGFTMPEDTQRHFLEHPEIFIHV